MLRASLLMLFAAALVAQNATDPAPTPAPATPGVPAVPAITRPFLGVTLDAEGASFDPAAGLPVASVIPGSTAALMGVKVGDHLCQANGTPLAAPADLGTALEAIPAGAALRLSVRRGDELLVLDGTASLMPQPSELARRRVELRAQVDAVRAAADRSDPEVLDALLKRLRRVEDGLPAAAEAFKRTYPDGEVDISIRIDIRSDPTAPAATPLGPAADPSSEDPSPTP
ncbi:MAG: PDZ domain-containing protein [Planctomycetes bacterium]|nr:PDZ domain-containing protein [Planctomycetota bacterium]